jgi:hypothetical protein
MMTTCARMCRRQLRASCLHRRTSGKHLGALLVHNAHYFEAAAPGRWLRVLKSSYWRSRFMRIFFGQALRARDRTARNRAEWHRHEVKTARRDQSFLAWQAKVEGSRGLRAILKHSRASLGVALSAQRSAILEA